MSRPRAAVLAIVFLIAGGVFAGAQAPASMPEPQLKALWLYNFAQFTDWPQGLLATTDPLVICTVSGPVADELGPMVAGKFVGSHPVKLQRVKLDGPFLGCSVLYVGKVDSKASTQIVAMLQNSPVLSVADTEAFTRAGGMLYFFVEDGLKFGVNIDSAVRAGLHVKANVLKMAKKIIK